MHGMLFPRAGKKAALRVKSSYTGAKRQSALRTARVGARHCAGGAHWRACSRAASARSAQGQPDFLHRPPSLLQNTRSSQRGKLRPFGSC